MSTKHTKVLLFIVLILVFPIRGFSQGFVPQGRDFRVNTTTSRLQWKPKIVTFDQGGFAVCWQSEGQNRPGMDLYVQCYDSLGHSVGSEIRVNEGELGYFFGHNILPLGSGKFVVAWQNSLFKKNLYYCILSSTGEIVRPQQAVRLSAETCHWGLTLLPPNKFALLWFDESAIVHYLRGIAIDYNGIEFPRLLPVFYRGNSITTPFVTHDESGKLFITWNSEIPDSRTIIKHIIAAHKYGFAGMHNDVNSDSLDRHYTKYLRSIILPISSEYVFLITDHFDENKNHFIRFGRYTKDLVYYADLGTLSAPIGEHYDELEYIGGYEGAFLLGWNLDVSSSRDNPTYFKRVSKMGDVRSEKTLVFDYKVIGTKLKDNQFIACWLEREYGKPVMAQYFTRDLDRLGDPFPLQSSRAFEVENPVVAHIGGGRFVCVWDVWASHETNRDIYAAIFEPPPTKAFLHQLHNFSILSPSNDETVHSTSLMIRWSSATNQQFWYPQEVVYTVYLDSLDSFSSPSIYMVNRDTTLKLSELPPGRTYFCKIKATNINGDELWSKPSAFFVSYAATNVSRSLYLPDDLSLLSNYPNPFNPTTTISFDLPSDGFVTLKIYDITGRLVRVLVQEQKLAGAHSVLWDGLDDAGQKVAAGVYLYRIEFVDAAGERMVMTRKMSLVR